MGTAPYKAIFCGDIPLHKPYIGLIYGRYLQSIGSWVTAIEYVGLLFHCSILMIDIQGG